MTLRSWPRSGVPRAMRNFEDFCAAANRLTRAAGVDDYLAPAAERLREVLGRVHEHAQELGCSDQLELLRELLRKGGGARRQRQFHEIAGMDALLRELTRATAAGAAQ